MAQTIYEFDPVTHITAGAIGEPGHRTFFIQAQYGMDTISLLCEKQHVQALIQAIDEMLANLEEEFGITRHSDLTVDAAVMAIKEPVDPLFPVGAMGLGYDANRDRVLLVAQEAAEESDDESELPEDPVERAKIILQVFGLEAAQALLENAEAVQELDLFWAKGAAPSVLGEKLANMLLGLEIVVEVKGDDLGRQAREQLGWSPQRAGKFAAAFEKTIKAASQAA